MIITSLPHFDGFFRFREGSRSTGLTHLLLVHRGLALRTHISDNHRFTGKPGTRKSSLAYAVAHELKLGRVLRLSVTSRSALQEGLYRYDAIGRLQEANLTSKTLDIGQFIRRGA